MWDCMSVDSEDVTFTFVGVVSVICALQSKGFIFRNGTSLCNSAESVLVSGPLSDLSLCHLHGPDSGQPFLRGPQYQVSL